MAPKLKQRKNRRLRDMTAEEQRYEELMINVIEEILLENKKSDHTIKAYNNDITLGNTNGSRQGGATGNFTGFVTYL
jgi:hypothetical protein